MSVRARVQITVEIVAGSHWGDGVNAGQVRKQAIDDVEGALRRGLVIHGLVSGMGPPGEKTPARIIGDPKVTAIISDVEEKR